MFELTMLILGVVVPTGHRFVLGIPEGTNSTIETGVFCARFDIKMEECDKVLYNYIVTYNL